MSRVFPILLLASLTACTAKSIGPGERLAPVPPPLPAALSAPCPAPAQLTDKSIGELAQGDINAILESHDCRLRHAATVNAYVAARQASIDWNQAKQLNGKPLKAPAARNGQSTSTGSDKGPRD